ncbi:DNA-3-methyladenine glycosylase I [Aquihabitans sp. G128]|uniref:DNA-3-methyladenine glycosylase I n=1 Tax=Aquihabitans sp. G128 TaxID=2849779 RepID=UPI001C24AE88|nr:DNA-3-methyladenine glycosylase I [Aquihabitans sp. G128]QXC60738.1 DNA-3-methyladenine glycosylase I [Aquihabitans sp. G128]
MSAAPIPSAADGGPVVGEDGLARCPWGATDGLLREYHDGEWGVGVHGEAPLFERLVLEGFQSGLSWLTILRKRPAFRTAFADFDPEAVAAFVDDRVEALMADAAIVRNRAKIEAARANARAVVALRDHGGLDRFLWSRRPATSPAPTVVREVPATSPESKALAKDLKAAGFRFVGPTTAHALMEATGMIDTHLVSCHRRGCGPA